MRTCLRPATTRRSSAALKPASFSALRQCSTVFLTSRTPALFERGAGEPHRQMLRALWSAVMKGRLISVCVVRRQLDLRLFSLPSALQRELVVRRFDALLLLEFVGQVATRRIRNLRRRGGVAVVDSPRHAVADFGESRRPNVPPAEIDTAIVPVWVCPDHNRAQPRRLVVMRSTSSPRSCRRPWSPGAGR